MQIAAKPAASAISNDGGVKIVSNLKRPRPAAGGDDTDDSSQGRLTHISAKRVRFADCDGNGTLCTFAAAFEWRTPSSPLRDLSTAMRESSDDSDSDVDMNASSGDLLASKPAPVKREEKKHDEKTNAGAGAKPQNKQKQKKKKKNMQKQTKTSPSKHAKQTEQPDPTKVLVVCAPGKPKQFTYPHVPKADPDTSADADRVIALWPLAAKTKTVDGVDMQKCYYVQTRGQLRLGWLKQSAIDWSPLELFDRQGTYVLQPAGICLRTGLPRHYVWYREDGFEGVEYDFVIQALGMDVDATKGRMNLCPSQATVLSTPSIPKLVSPSIVTPLGNGFLFRLDRTRMDFPDLELCAVCHEYGKWTLRWMIPPRGAPRATDLRLKARKARWFLAPIDPDTGLRQVDGGGGAHGWELEWACWIGFLCGDFYFDKHYWPVFRTEEGRRRSSEHVNTLVNSKIFS